MIETMNEAIKAAKHLVGKDVNDFEMLLIADAIIVFLSEQEEDE